MAITFEYQDRTYTWEGRFGGVISSKEKGLKKGEVRYIQGDLYYVFAVYKFWEGGFFRKPRIVWGLVEPVSIEKIAEIRQRVLGC